MPELTLREFLERYPWRADETRGKKPLDYLWRFKLPVSPHDLWPFLIDTSTFNKMLGLPVMHYEEKNGRLYGQTNNAGFVMEWE
ncbi:MAG: hypothetical protein NZV14_20190, partial [Bryobacteraceae bacterium]|nr:hypothetical protein [Bryobacteraceae bacterium]MDW8380483.1 hypothetical protein [Bryobacterales bacterium]